MDWINPRSSSHFLRNHILLNKDQSRFPKTMGFGGKGEDLQQRPVGEHWCASRS